MKKIIVLFVTLAMLISACPYVSAADGNTRKAAQAAELLSGMGILDAGFSDFDADAKRGFTVGIASKLITGEVSVGYENKYKDVFESTPYMSEILFMSDLGYIGGYDSNEFLPDNPITYGEFAKMLVMMLGYEQNAKFNGGYPNGYILTMNNLGITISGKTAFEKLTNADVIMALYDAVMIETNEIDEIKGNQITTGKGDSILEKKDVFKLQGVVSQAGGASVGYSTNAALCSQIQIGSYLIDTTLNNPIEYLGKTVTAYVKETDGVYELMSVVKTEYDKEIVIEADGEHGISWRRENDSTIILNYYLDSKSKTIRLPSDSMYYYNGRLTTDYSVIEAALDMTQGSIRVLETREGTYVFLNEYIDIIVSVIDKEEYTLRDALVYNKIEIPVDNSHAYVGIYSDDGKITFSDIKVGDTVSIFQSIDGTYAEMYVHNEKISGTVTSCLEDTYKVDGTEYRLNEGILRAISQQKKSFREIKANDSVTFRLNKFGRVVDVELSRNDLTYAYMYKAASLENETGFEDYIEVFKLFNIEKGGVEKYYAKPKLKVNGKTCKNAEEANTRIEELIRAWGQNDMLVKVKYSGDQEITAIEIPVKNSDDNDRLRWAANYDKTTPEEVTRVGGKYIYDSSTLILEVFDGEEIVEKKETNYLQKDFDKEHNYELYDPDELNFVGAMVLRVKSGYEMDNSAIYYGDPVYIVDGISETWLEDEGSEGMLIKAYSDGGTKLQELVVTGDEVYNIDSNIDTTFKDMCYNVPMKDGIRCGQYGYGDLEISDLKKGDVIQVERNVLGKVNRFRVLARLSELNGFFDNVAFGGRINNPYSMFTYGRISYMNQRAFVVDFDNDERTYITDNVPVIVYNRNTNKFTGGSMADIGEGSNVIVRAKKFKLSFIILMED